MTTSRKNWEAVHSLADIVESLGHADEATAKKIAAIKASAMSRLSGERMNIEGSADVRLREADVVIRMLESECGQLRRQRDAAENELHWLRQVHEAAKAVVTMEWGDEAKGGHDGMTGAWIQLQGALMMARKPRSE